MIEFVYYRPGETPIVNKGSMLKKKVGGAIYNTYLIFETKETMIDSEDVQPLISNQVLKILSEDLKNIGFDVEEDKPIDLEYDVGNGRTRTFQPDAHNPQTKIAIEIESGQAKSNYKFLKDFFEAIVLDKVDYMIIAVRRFYKTKKKSGTTVTSRDYQYIIDCLNAYDIAINHNWPIKGLMVIGY